MYVASYRYINARNIPISYEMTKSPKVHLLSHHCFSKCMPTIFFTSRQQRLQFRPPFEEVRAKYYREMKKFISIPLHFRGVSDDTSIYPPLIEHHASAFSVVYAKAEKLLTRLSKILDDFKDWVTLGMVDIDAMVDEHLQSTSDWEKNFKALKAKGREAEKLPGWV